jgi:hypothetical protein
MGDHPAQPRLARRPSSRASQTFGTRQAFIDRYNQTARPFGWKFTASDLAGLLQRISARQEPAGLPEAA